MQIQIEISAWLSPLAPRIAGLVHFSAGRVLSAVGSAARAALGLALLLALFTWGSIFAQDTRPGEAEGSVVVRMEKANAERQAALQSYWSRRRYVAKNPRLRREASIVVEAHFAAPDEKQFEVIESSGSRVVENRVFTPLLESERANARAPARDGVEICRRNYVFSFAGYDTEAQAYVFNVEPRTPNKYLFRGKIWVTAGDYAIQRLEGEPAQRPSFWVRNTHFVHEYAKFGDFWFPVRNRTEVQLRLFGRSTLEIEYMDYRWQPRPDSARIVLPPPAETLPLPVRARAEVSH